MEKVFVYDTTLRDGTQGEGISLSVEDKYKITQKLDALGVDYIEGGWPGSNPKDMEYFERVQNLTLKHAKITAFTSTRRSGLKAEEDKNLQAILMSNISTVAVFGKTWDLHVKEALKVPLAENVKMISDTVSFLKSKGKEVIYDAEHFFDGYKNNPTYALKTLKAAADAGADWIVLCDTNGGSLPEDITEIVSYLKEEIHVALGIHAHNDGELAVANTLAAVRAGVRQVQGTTNGFGERCGNANLCSVIPNLELKYKYKVLPTDQLKLLTETARYVAEIANVAMPVNMPYVGQSSFAHKGGIHVSAVLKNPVTYEHINPETVGNSRRVLVSELAGLSNLRYKAREFNLDLHMETPQSREIVDRIKTLEHEGFEFESAEASLELLLRKGFGKFKDFFDLESLKIINEKRSNAEITTEAIIKLKVNGEIVHTAAEGNGPVNALDNALRKALEHFYPQLSDMHLSDYKVRVLNEKDGTAANVRVLIESRDAHGSWDTVGVSENIIEASWQALLDSMNYYLLKKMEK